MAMFNDERLRANYLEEEMDLLLAGALLVDDVLQRDAEEERERRRREIWVREWIIRRPMLGFYDTLLMELNREDAGGYLRYLRVDPALFMDMLHRIGPRITKQNTHLRMSLDPGIKLAIALRFMAGGDNYKTLKYNFRVGDNTISLFIPEVADAIYEEYAPEHLHCPSTPEEWQAVADAFGKLWQFHNCVGAVDGKHVGIRAPAHSGTFYHNYKGFFSIILMAVCDARYRFLFVDVGANGSCSDAGVFRDTNIYRAVMDETINFPEPQLIPHDTKPLPFFFCGDDAFGLKRWMMKPYPRIGLAHDERIFNYRLSRARRIVESAFGLLSQRLFDCKTSIYINEIMYCHLTCCIFNA